tara:strand:+ start:394 stop:621 length:228 start_codon:yes stop_codon:yes gene_type:complete
MNKTQETIEYLQILLKARQDIIEDDDLVESKNIDRAFLFLEIIGLEVKRIDKLFWDVMFGEEFMADKNPNKKWRA